MKKSATWAVVAVGVFVADAEDCIEKSEISGGKVAVEETPEEVDEEER